MRRGRGDRDLEQAAASRQLAAGQVRLSTTKKSQRNRFGCIAGSRKSLETAPNVIPDESACGGRDPVSSKLLFFLDSGYPPSADSGMTDLMLVLKVLSFLAVC